MTEPSCVVLFGQESEFFEYAAFHLASAGLRTIAVTDPACLTQVTLANQPRAVLMHWDTLGDACLRFCAMLKARIHTPILVVTSRFGSGVNVVSVFASGADGLIDGAANPRLLTQRVKSLLGPRLRGAEFSKERLQGWR